MVVCHSRENWYGQEIGIPTTRTHTVVDKLSTVNYKIQIIGGIKSQIVHRNRLKICFSNPDLPAAQQHTNIEASASKPNNNSECFACVEHDQGAAESFKKVTKVTCKTLKIKIWMLNHTIPLDHH